MAHPYEGDVPPSLIPPPPLCLKPYNFEIKDFDQMKNLLHCNTPIGAPIIKCPDYHVQLDHTLAVIWLFYSDMKNWSKLTTSHLEWAIRFIDGVLSLSVNGENPDVEFIKTNLEELLIVYYAEVDVNKFSGETGRVTAMPVIEQTKMDSSETKKILETVTINTTGGQNTYKKPNDVEENLIKQLSNELAYIKRCRAKLHKRIKSSCKVNRLVQDVKSQVADIKRLSQNFHKLKDASSFIFINNLNKGF